MRSVRLWGRMVVVAAVLSGMAGVPQTTQPTAQQTGTPPQGPITNSSDPFGDKAQDDKDRVDLPATMQQRLILARQTERQKRIVADTDKLLALATQLHTDVAKSNKDILSLDVVRRADEIERLAHAVKEHMKG